MWIKCARCYERSGYPRSPTDEPSKKQEFPIDYEVNSRPCVRNFNHGSILFMLKWKPLSVEYIHYWQSQKKVALPPFNFALDQSAQLAKQYQTSHSGPHKPNSVYYPNLSKVPFEVRDRTNKTFVYLIVARSSSISEALRAVLNVRLRVGTADTRADCGRELEGSEATTVPESISMLSDEGASGAFADGFGCVDDLVEGGALVGRFEEVEFCSLSLISGSWGGGASFKISFRMRKTCGK